MQLDKAIKSRKSVRKFNSKKPDWRKIIEAIDSARYAPMSGGSYTPKFILVDDPEKINKLSEYAQQDFIKTAHYVIVVCSANKRTFNEYGKRGERYSRQQAGAAVQNILLSLEEKGLSTCWVGHFKDSDIKHLLGVEEGIDIEVILPVGYEFKKSKPSSKIELDRILYFNEYDNKKMKEPKMARV